MSIGAVLVIVFVRKSACGNNQPQPPEGVAGNEYRKSDLAGELLGGHEAVFHQHRSRFLDFNDVEDKESKSVLGENDSLVVHHLSSQRRGAESPLPVTVECLYVRMDGPDSACQKMHDLQREAPWQHEADKGFLWSHVIRIEEASESQDDGVDVGYGMSTLRISDAHGNDKVQRAVFGYLSASEDWVWMALLSAESEKNADRLRREASDLSRRRQVDVDRFYESQLVGGANAAVVANLQQKKYLYHDGLTKLTWMNARRAWHLEAVESAVADGIDSLKASTEDISRVDATRRDSRRNYFLFALSVITFAQTSLYLYDFLVMDDSTIGPTIRVLLFLFVALGAATIAVWVMIKLVLQRRSVMRVRRTSHETQAPEDY